jgi:hypothetical protein
MRTIPPEIVAAAQSAQKATGIPASISLGQWALESGWGEHIPPHSNNFFGVKAVAGQPFVVVETREVVHGAWVKIPAMFRVYPNVEDAFLEHARLLADSPHYLPARMQLPSVQGFVHALTGVYATDPLYGQKLWSMILDEDLRRFDILETKTMSNTDLSPPPVAPATPAPAAPLIPPDLQALIAAAAAQAAAQASAAGGITAAQLETDAKPILQSRTLWALMVTAVAAVASHYGHSISLTTQQAWITDALDMVQYAGLASAALFRVVSTKQLT